jgi:hypothetical protein
MTYAYNINQKVSHGRHINTLIYAKLENRASSVSILMRRPMLDSRQRQELSQRHRFQTAHPVLYQVGSAVLCLQAKRPGCAEVKNAWSYTSTSAPP